MAATHKKLASGQLGESTAAIYTVPASTTGMVKTILLHNTGSTSVSAEVNYNGSAASTKILNVNLDGAETFEYSVGHMIPLSAAETLQGKADSATTINYHIFGAEE
jgi:hypothetical protein